MIPPSDLSSDEMFRRLLDAAPDAMVIADGLGQVMLVNARAEEMFGRPRDQLVGAHVDTLLPERYRAGHAAHRAAYLADPQFRPMGPRGAMWALRADGVEIPVEISLGPVRFDHQLWVATTLRDARPRREAEETAARLAAIVTSSDDAIYSATLDGVIDTWNAGATRLYGYADHEIVGREIAILVAAERDDRAMIRERLAAGETVANYETVRRRKDGTLVEVSLTISPIRRDGRITASSAIARDITERRRLEARIRQSERLAALGTMAAGLGHEINNPLASILANVAYAREIAATAGAVGEKMRDLREALADAEEGADRVRRIVHDLRRFGRGDVVEAAVLDLATVIDGAVRMTANLVRHHALSTRDYERGLLVNADEGQLMQVFTNLLVNAAHAVEEKGGTGNEIAITTYGRAGGWVVAEIRDTGTGIAPEVLPRIFDPFYTTKDVGRGTGLGLAISHGIVATAGGEITVDSVPGVGSTFRVTLPRASAPTAATAAQPRAGGANRRGRILVIDDQLDVARAFVRALKDEHEVTVVGSGAAAIAELGPDVDYDVVFCDLMMPDITGMEVYERTRAHSPELANRFVFMTGGAFSPRATEFLATTPNRLLSKPLAVQELRAIARDLVRR